MIYGKGVAFVLADDTSDGGGAISVADVEAPIMAADAVLYSVSSQDLRGRLAADIRHFCRFNASSRQQPVNKFAIILAT